MDDNITTMISENSYSTEYTLLHRNGKRVLRASPTNMHMYKVHDVECPVCFIGYLRTIIEVCHTHM